MPTCAVCQEREHKYKCPTCRILYCSVACYKKHRETPCAPPPASPLPAKAPASLWDTEFDDDEGFRLQPAQIQRMLGCAELQALFKQRRMRDIIRLVDGGHVSLDKAREEDPDFMRMTIKLLEVINPEGPPQ